MGFSKGVLEGSVVDLGLQAHGLFAGGASRQLFHAGFTTRWQTMGVPQCAQQGTGMGLGGGSPICRERPVWKAMRSRRALAAGWQNP